MRSAVLRAGVLTGESGVPDNDATIQKSEPPTSKPGMAMSSRATKLTRMSVWGR
jgi:hypothetical protein